MTSEVWELVNINGNRTGVMIERGTNTPIPHGMYHEAVDIWTKNRIFAKKVRKIGRFEQV